MIISLEAIYNVFDPTAKTFCENRRLTIALLSHSILHVSLHKVTPLHVAAEKGHFEKIVGYLLQNGTTINVKDSNGVSLHY